MTLLTLPKSNTKSLQEIKILKKGPILSLLKSLKGMFEQNAPCNLASLGASRRSQGIFLKAKKKGSLEASFFFSLFHFFN
jgi:hypothetical protein